VKLIIMQETVSNGHTKRKEMYTRIGAQWEVEETMLRRCSKMLRRNMSDMPKNVNERRIFL
jgi:hypothetical protein